MFLKKKPFFKILGIAVAITLVGFSRPHDKPTLYIIGDSTVKNTTASDSDALWGWGNIINDYFDTTQIIIENKAIGGRSSRSFVNEGRWEEIKEKLKPGDFVLMQFGTNDLGGLSSGSSRASLKGLAADSILTYNKDLKYKEFVHTYGWYLSKIITETIKSGASPIVCSLIPRNIWKDGKVGRNDTDYALWAQQVSKNNKTGFIALNTLIADTYDSLGAEKIAHFFPKDHTHTNKAGADFNAQKVVEGLRVLSKTNQFGNELAHYLKKTKIIKPRQSENLGRGLIAMRKKSDSVFLSWRLFSYDDKNISFNIYRKTGNLNAIKINDSPLSDRTWFIDLNADFSYSNAYYVIPVLNGVEQTKSQSSIFKLLANAPIKSYLSIPLEPPISATSDITYSANDASVGDLDGDGEYEIVLKWDPSNSKDNSQSGVTGNVFIDAYKLNGTRLWRIDLGKNIRAGAHYTQFSVFDFDGDGRAEVAFKTADGTVDGVGKVIGNASADYRNANGYILDGPEYLTVFEGVTGKALDTKPFVPARGDVSSWGDRYGNRVDRYLASVAYLDGMHPSLIEGRGYYTRLVRVAWDFQNGKLSQKWIFDSKNGHKDFEDQGNHQLMVADVDNDGKDEIFNGSSAIDHDGNPLWVNGRQHGDAMHITKFKPNDTYQKIWECYENPQTNGNYGLGLNNAQTGALIFGIPETTKDIGRALAADIDPLHEGLEMWGAKGNLYSSDGQIISSNKPSMNFAIWWDGDLSRELLDDISIRKWNYLTNKEETIFSADGCASNNGTKATPCISGDILGDWREEVVFRTEDSKELRIYSTTIPTSHRLYSLVNDPQYRLALAWQNTAYNQPPYVSFYLGTGMSEPPIPYILPVKNDTHKK
ncbi:rhamnogalacturonan lyase family protein [Rhizosphaericola mali]|uniref:Rhamnogalacturonan I lyase beta-sheet domain-containing protein n=1 Tax=Rhizosphaericola mali TaxID=2545455 RepID=A0A5P2G2G2_9BACT|nr:GDSL-type esterase/lipase family protein [Rhizosphaericola mali]QES88289.1 hypothetical protein E0W69_006275 [Rhizosphaericola mali]